MALRQFSCTKNMQIPFLLASSTELRKFTEFDNSSTLSVKKNKTNNTD